MPRFAVISACLLAALAALAAVLLLTGVVKTAPVSAALMGLRATLTADAGPSVASADTQSTSAQGPSDWHDPWGAPRRGEALRAAAVDVDRPTLTDAGYAPLRQAIAMYREIVAWGGWAPIPPGRPLKAGLRDADRVPLLRTRLIATGDLGSTGGDAAFFDDRLTRAVQRFQARHGLRQDGVVGRRTLEALNVSAQTRLAGLERNLERLLKLSDGLGHRYVFVNIAGQELEAVRDGRVERRHRVVIGTKERQTPAYESQITFLAFNPYWHVPRTIAEEDILPLARYDPQYLSRLNMRLYRRDGWVEVDPATIDWRTFTPGAYVLRQEPGARNALGTVKIHFPNPHAVYLHDTPSKRLFGNHIRAHSSGCVRVEDAHALTAWLLSAQGWDRARVDAMVAAGTRKDVRLQEAVPIYLIYLTAWVDAYGVVNFRDDIYDRDRLQATL